MNWARSQSVKETGLKGWINQRDKCFCAELDERQTVHKISCDGEWRLKGLFRYLEHAGRNIALHCRLFLSSHNSIFTV